MDALRPSRALPLRLPALLGALLLCWTPGAGAQFLEEGMSTSSMVNYPTARDQLTDHALHASFQIEDIEEPLINLESFRYAFQLGNFQVMADARSRLEPEHEFDYAEVKGKLRVLNLDELRTNGAIGILGRGVEEHDEELERKARIDDRESSLFGVLTTEVFPFQTWGGVLLNFYLDNRVFSTGAKFQVYQFIKIVDESTWYHSREVDAYEAVFGEEPDNQTNTLGLEFEGEQNFYFQLLYEDVSDSALIRLGTGF